MLCHSAWCNQGSSGRAGGVVKPVTSERSTAWGGGKNTGFARAPVARCPPAAAMRTFSSANASPSTSSPVENQAASPASLTRTIGCQITGT